MCVAWSPDSARLAAGSRDGSVQIWDPDRALLVARLTGHANYVKSLAWTPDAQGLLSASGDHDVRVWDLASPDEVAAATVEYDRIRALLEPSVERELEARGDAAGVSRWIETESGLAPREREIAGQILLSRAVADTAAADRRAR